VHSTVPFHRWLVAHPEFRAGRLHTRFIDEHLKPDTLASGGEHAEAALVAAALHARAERLKLAPPKERPAEAASPWKWSLRAGRSPRWPA
jgi:acetyl/propionyl-CoA carboxylase alpha subunit